MLKITRADDPITVEHIILAIYSNPGFGKTTLGFSANAPVLMDFDQGCYRAANRGDSVQVESWQDVTNITAEDLAPFQTIVIDTAGRALDFLTADIIKRNAKMGRGGALTLQGYGQLKTEFTAWLKSLKVMGKDVVLIAHSSEDKSGDDLIERLDVQGGSKGEIYKSADAMGRLSIVNGRRVLNFSPTDTAFGKNPGNLDPLEVPDISTSPRFMGEIIQTIKGRLNSLSAEQQRRQKLIAEWLEKIDQAEAVEQFNELATATKDADPAIIPVIKGAIHKAAKAAGYKPDAAQGCYV